MSRFEPSISKRKKYNGHRFRPSEGIYNIIQLAEYAGKAQIVGNLIVFITVSIAFRTP